MRQRGSYNPLPDEKGTESTEDGETPITYAICYNPLPDEKGTESTV